MAKDKSKSPAEQKIERQKLKAANFLKLAPKRMTRALKSIEVIGNLSNRGSYSYDPAQVAQMMNALAEAVKGVNARFSAPASKEAPSGFQFK